MEGNQCVRGLLVPDKEGEEVRTWFRPDRVADISQKLFDPKFTLHPHSLFGASPTSSIPQSFYVVLTPPK